MSQPRLKRSPYDDAAEAELSRWPGVSWRTEVRGKHYALVLTFNGVSRFVTYPTSPGDTTRGPLNHVSDIRKALTALGAMRLKSERSTAPKRWRNRTEASGLNLVSLADTRLAKDPFAALAQVKFLAPETPPPAPEPRLGWWRRALRWLGKPTR